MKSRYLLIATILLAMVSCAKEKTAGKNDDAKRYFDAWISQNYPNAVRTDLGAYILSEVKGSGQAIADSAYIRLNYTTYSLDGNLKGTTYERVARKNGSYERSTYYGPLVVFRGEDLDGLPSGLEEAVSSMNVGGRKTVVIPGWLSTTDRYDSAEEYVKNCSGSDTIYDIEMVDSFNDVTAWERDSLLRFMAANYPGAVEDTLYEGFFYVKESGTSTIEFSDDTTCYINYTGRLLSGSVFDTTIADTAKVWGLYSSSTTYSQKKVSWYSAEASEDFTAITLGDDDSKVISGFAYAMSQMHPYEIGKCFFVSSYGYAASGSGTSIPSYAPLCFEIAFTDAP